MERMIFNNRLRVCLFFLLVSLFLTWKLVTGLRVDASFQKMVPLEHAFIQNMLRHMEDGGNSGNTIRIAVAARDGDIFSADYIRTYALTALIKDGLSQSLPSEKLSIKSQIASLSASFLTR